jgi:hypothetical protein
VAGGGTPTPTPSRLRRALRPGLIAAAVGVASTLYLLVGLRFGVPNIFDEPYQTLGASRMLEGWVPYRDFLYSYPPGELALLSSAFRLFGPSLLVKRVVYVVVDGVLASCLYLLARRLVPGRWALMAPLLYVLWKGGALMPGQYQAGRATALVLASVAHLVIQGAAAPGRAVQVLAAGTLAGAAVTMRLDAGLALSLAVVTPATIVTLLYAGAHRGARGASNDEPVRTGGRRWLEWLRPLVLAGRRVVLPFALGWTAVVGLVAVIAGTAAGWEPLLADVVFLPSSYLPFERAAVIPLLDLAAVSGGATALIGYLGAVYYTNFVYVSAAVLLAAGTLCLRRLLTGCWLAGPAAAGSQTAAWLTLAGLASLPTALRRPDAGHFIPIMAIVSPLLVWVGIEAYRWARQRSQARLLPLMATLIAGLILVVAVGPQRTRLELIQAELQPRIGGRTSLGAMAPIGLPRAGGVHADAAYVRPLVEAVSYVQGHTAPGERIFVANRHHQTVFVNDMMFYFLAERNPATRYDLFVWGLTTREDVQRHIATDLAQRARFIVVNTDEALTLQEGGLPGSPWLDQYIASHYELAADFERYRVLRRAGVSP